ncbi:MAG TPA: non-heme iron oxygenase ferredoxin subunit [Candidatus Bathyarchaeia archaeon]|nr:non-heme iron oxygenase ferredoxin subunit [Candidatus Bathyarchaeia archaeon]
MGRYVKAAAVDEVKPGESKLVELEGKSIALFNVDGTFYALDDACPHSGGPLSEGRLQGSRVTCPWHGSIFDVTDGKVLDEPATENAASYPVRVVGADVEIEI